MPQKNNKKSKIENRKPIPLFYWSEKKFSFKEKENYGDLLSKYLVEEISGRPIQWVQPKKQAWYKWDKKNYLVIGSIIHHATKDSIVWGSGIIDRKQEVAPADFRAVRGPQTRKFLLQLDYDCPEVYGDPALLLPLYYRPKQEKRYRIGIVPHYIDFELVKKRYEGDEEIAVIDLLTNNIETTTDEILRCEKIISSSLHGIIVAHAYKIPAVWVKFSNKIFGDDIKYLDYFESVELETYEPAFLDVHRTTAELLQFFENVPVLPEENTLLRIQKDLINSCCFQ